MPIFVYLDQKDFGALLEPANAPLRAELKGWTEIGDVVIPVSLIHVIETSKAKPALRTWLFELIAGVDLDALPLHVITAPTVRLDLARDQKKLRRTVEQLRPRLLVLDPFVRLHRVDENAAADVAPLLAYLRPLERELSTAVLLVHHARKGAAHARAGQALRGSSELHAWGDSNLYLRRRGEALLMTVEHRAAAPIQALALELRAEADALALRIVEDAVVDLAPEPPSAHERIEAALADIDQPISRRALRAACRMRMATLCEALNELVDAGRVVDSDGRYRLASP